MGMLEGQSPNVSGTILATKLDDLAAPDDNTDLNASTTKHGLMPKGDGNTAHFFNGANAQTTPDHGSIGGLADDDHAQYSLVAGTRAFSGRVQGPVQALTHGATVTVNAALANTFTLTLSGATAEMSNPSNLVAGDTLVFIIKQDATGGRALTFASAYDFGTEGAPTLTGMAANKYALISCLALTTSLMACTTLKTFG